MSFLDNFELPSFFTGDKGKGFLTPEQLEARRKIAIALASRRSAYPKTIGEGLTALGEGIADRRALNELDAAEQQNAKQMQDWLGKTTPYQPGAATPVAPAAQPAPTEPPPAAAPAPAPAPRRQAETPLASGIQTMPSIMAQASTQPQQAMSADEATQRLRRATTGSTVGDPYKALGAQNNSGDRGYGAYEIMASRIPSLTAAHAGREMTPDEFLNDPKAQDAVAAAQFAGYQKQFGDDNKAAAAFYGGPNYEKDQRPEFQARVADFQKRFNQPLVDRTQLAGSLANQGNSPLPASDGASAAGIASPQQPRVRTAALNTTVSDASPAVPGRADIAGAADGRQMPPQRIAQAPGQPQFQKAPTAPDNPYPYATSVIGQPLRPEPKPPTPTPMSREELQWHNVPPAMIGTRYHEQAKAQQQLYAQDRARRDAEAQANFQEQMKLYSEEKKKYVDVEAAGPTTRAGLAQSAQTLEDAKLKTAGIPDSVKGVAQLQSQMERSQRVLDNINKGYYNGILGEFDYQKARAMKAIGRSDPQTDERIRVTEEMKADMAALAGAKRLEVAGPGAPSNKDMDLLLDAAAGRITFTPEAVRRVTEASQRVQLAEAMDHQKKLAQFVKENPGSAETIYGRYGLNMENFVPRNHPSVQRLMANPDMAHARQFDEKYHTPGLAMKILERESRRQ